MAAAVAVVAAVEVEVEGAGGVEAVEGVAVPMEVPMVVRMAVEAVAAVAAVGAQWSSTTAPLVEALEAGALEAVQEAWVATRVVDVGCVVDMDMNRAVADTGSSPSAQARHERA